MKKFFMLALVCCLVFSSSSIVFATPTQWDTSDQTNLSNIAKALTTTSTGTLLRSVNAILTALTSPTQDGSLYNGVVYLYDIREYARQIASGLNGTNGSFLEKIYNALIHTDAAGIVYSYVTDIYQKVTEIDNTVLTIGTRLSNIYTQVTNIAANTAAMHTLQNTNLPYLSALSNTYGNGYWDSNKRISMLVRRSDGSGNNTSYTLQLGTGNPFSDFLKFYVISSNNQIGYWSDLMVGAKSQRSYTDWNTLQTNNFTPSSGVNGIYGYLAAMQTPLARLAYVHASDEEIAARQKAEANQTAVVDNFIDSSGSGSASPSNFGSVSDLSSGFKDNIATDASVSGIWNIFNSDNFGWFSQETADQLDTSGSNTRMFKSSASYPTPLLDQQTEDILNYLGGNNND